MAKFEVTDEMIDAAVGAVPGGIYRVDALRAIEAALEVAFKKPAAWKHTMDNTEGIKGNKPWTVMTTTKANPFGRPGIDYSASCPVTSEPLYAIRLRRK